MFLTPVCPLQTPLPTTNVEEGGNFENQISYQLINEIMAANVNQISYQFLSVNASHALLYAPAALLWALLDHQVKFLGS
jgi:hypothetical protein